MSSSVKTIACRFEGGAGDHLLSARFLPAILEKHPGAEITIYSDSNGKTFQKEVLEASYGHLFKEVIVIPSKRYSEFWVDCQFGTDNFYGALENVPDPILSEMTTGYDRFYDLHIDGLKWQQYDFDALRYFSFFPKPQLTGSIPAYLPKDYVVVHLHSATSVGHRLEDFYITGLIDRLLKFTNVVAISTKESNYLYNSIDGEQSNELFVINENVKDVLAIIAGAKAMVSTDSGFRYIAYASNVPTITFSSNCAGQGRIPVSHQLRWLMFPNHTLPLNFNFVYVSNAIKNILSNKAYSFFPFVGNLEDEFVIRNYTINKEKTK